jgi:hypothetical protein
LGKWQTADPLGYPDGWNNLAYVNNGVTSAIDWLWGTLLHVMDEMIIAGTERWEIGWGSKEYKSGYVWEDFGAIWKGTDNHWYQTENKYRGTQFHEYNVQSASYHKITGFDAEIGVAIYGASYTKETSTNTDLEWGKYM